MHLPKSKTPILYTSFADEFGAARSDEVFVLPESDAAETWGRFISPGAHSYFQVPDDAPIVRARWERVGNWSNAYSQDNRGFVRELLQSKIEIPCNAKIFFMPRETLVLESSWGTFLDVWDQFLDVEDDYPFVAFDDPAARFIIFFALRGDLFLIPN